MPGDLVKRERSENEEVKLIYEEEDLMEGRVGRRVRQRNPVQVL